MSARPDASVHVVRLALSGARRRRVERVAAGLGIPLEEAVERLARFAFEGALAELGRERRGEDLPALRPVSGGAR